MAASPTTPSPGAAFAVGSFPGATSEDSMFPRPPPPTPKDHRPLPSADATLTALFDRMVLSPPVPILRFGAPSRLKIRSSATPLVSLDSPDLASLRAAGDVGYFHLVGHGIPSQLPSSALAELSRVDASALHASILSTLGFSVENEEVDADDEPVMVFDVDELGMDALPAALEYARLMREVGMQVVGLFSGSGEVGFGEKPFAEEGGRKARCLVWVSKVGSGESAVPPAASDAKAYPYVVGLHCEWEQEAGASSWVMDDSGEWRTVGASDGALLVTIGDIAQVWSNGKLKKVRGMARPTPAPSSDGEEGGEPARLSITVLITLPLDSIVSPLLPLSAVEDGGDVEEEEKEVVSEDGDEDGCSFRSFPLEDYAWGVYHDQLQFEDPLAPYRI